MRSSPRLPLALAVVLLHLSPSLALVPSVPFQDCSDPSASDARTRLNISTIYAQLTDSPRGRFLNLSLIGQSPSDILDLSNVTNLLSTVFAPTKVLTFLLNPDNESQFCSTLRPPSPLPPIQNASTNFCPLPPGPFAFAVGTRLSRSYELMTLNSRIRVVDTSSPPKELACVQLALTPLSSTPLNSPYGHATIVFWVSVALAIAYWLVVGAARLAAASKRGRQRVHNNLWSHLQGLGFVLASAISGESFASSPALMRFGTPSMRDVIFHTQWCTLLGMVAVQWPRFAYPFFAQTAWATLLYNISLTQGPDPSSKHWDPLHADPFNPPPSFADQLADPNSPLFINTTTPNSFFSFPSGISPTGIPALASAVGIRPRDAFGIATCLFLLILAGTIVLSVLIYAIDSLVGSLVRAAERRNGVPSETRTPPWSPGSIKEYAGSPEPAAGDDEPGAGNVRFLHRPASRTMHTLPIRTGWLSHRLGQSSFHSSVLHGNAVRVLILFHLPVTIFACFQFSQGAARSSLAGVILAALAFALISLAIPAWLVLRLTTTPTNKLYDETRTLLALGPLYNHYAHGSQLFAGLFFTTNIAYGVALGCGGQSGTAQAIIILVVEVGAALTTSVWLPWGRGATMGGISFMLCVSRIITAVLLVILSPIVSVGDDAGGWITYAILFIQGLVYLALLLMLLSKLLEGLIRLIFDVSFDRSKHTVDTGLLGAIGLAGCWGPRPRRRSKPRDEPARTRPPRTRPTRSASDATSQNMLPLPAPHHAAASASHTTVSGPPSVLRPEQLTAPYREESDDESGYILGAWHYDEDELGASSSSPTTPTSPVAPKPAASSTTGFSRVAGGRANIDAPYTMAGGLPPGAMAPAQAAIIEEAETPTPQGGTRARRSARGKHWFGLFGARGGRETEPMLVPDPLAGGSGGGGSFVVIRERRPSPLSQSLSAEEAEGADEGVKGFSVVRGPPQGQPRASASASARASASGASQPQPSRDGT